MKGLFRRPPFVEFGPCALDPPSHVRSVVTVRGSRPRILRAGVRRDCPHHPGVYGMIDRQGELIYVGKAKSLRSRLLGYFRPNSRDHRAEKIITEATKLLWEPAPSEFAALLRELELIRRHQPRFNVQGQPKRHRRTYVCVGRQPAAQAFLAAKPPATAQAWFGPVAGLTRAREAVRRLNDWYRLQDCPQKQTMVFADQAELFPAQRTPGCIRHDIGLCLAPCAAACSREEYTFHVRAMLDFLEGDDTTPLEMLERQMNEASAALQFERAASLLKRLEPLQWLFNHLERLRQAVRCSFVYPVDDHGGGQTWYLIRGGLVRAALPAPEDDSSREAARARLDEVYRTGAERPPGLDEVDGVLLVAGWFRRHRDERRRVIEVEAARARIAGAGLLTASRAGPIDPAAPE